MAILKCKMCGADLSPSGNEKICECEFCGTKQTFSLSSDEKVLKTISRGSLLRNKCEFDKARVLYEQLITENLADAEVYWNIVLCKYGVTYVDDYDGTKKPTINRMSNILISEDDDFNKCIELADVITREQYISEANQISSIQKEILDIVNKEEPYDIFISYKETDEFGERTRDSLKAYEIYEALTKKGYRVFLSRVVLSSIAGQNYEPYIYSALYSAQVMVLITSQEEYVNAAWVKNEWSRFLSLMKKDKNKVLIPCYLDMDAYDFPKELRNIQALDMSKLGFIQDLEEGINKIFKRFYKNSTKKVKDENNDLQNKFARCLVLLEDREYKKAQEIADGILLENASEPLGYYISALADCRLNRKNLIENIKELMDDKNFKRFLNLSKAENNSVLNELAKEAYDAFYIFLKNQVKEFTFLISKYIHSDDIDIRANIIKHYDAVKEKILETYDSSKEYEFKFYNLFGCELTNENDLIEFKNTLENDFKLLPEGYEINEFKITLNNGSELIKKFNNIRYYLAVLHSFPNFSNVKQLKNALNFFKNNVSYNRCLEEYISYIERLLGNINSVKINKNFILKAQNIELDFSFLDNDKMKMKPVIRGSKVSKEIWDANYTNVLSNYFKAPVCHTKFGGGVSFYSNGIFDKFLNIQISSNAKSNESYKFFGGLLNEFYAHVLSKSENFIFLSDQKTHWFIHDYYKNNIRENNNSSRENNALEHAQAYVVLSKKDINFYNVSEEKFKTSIKEGAPSKTSNIVFSNIEEAELNINENNVDDVNNSLTIKPKNKKSKVIWLLIGLILLACLSQLIVFLVITFMY